MASVIHVIEDDKVIAVDEIVNAYKTEDMIELIKARYQSYRVFVYPDASGKQDRTSASTTDIDQLKQSGFGVRALKSNPNVKDRINTMNKKFQNLSYLVNRNNCPTYTDCLEQLPYKNGAPDKTLDLDHPTDAGGYMIWHQYGKKKNLIYI